MLPTWTRPNCDSDSANTRLSVHTSNLQTHINEPLVSLEKNFIDSIKFRTQFDEQFSISKATCKLLETQYKETSQQAMQEPFFSIRQNICTLANSYAANNSANAYTYKCLADSHVFLRACVEQNAVKEKYMNLTIGDVSFRGQPLFNTTRSIIQNVVDDGISTRDNPRFHVWLTLADMTIIDFTINDYLAQQKQAEDSIPNISPVSVWRPERQAGLSYHPLLVDDAFLTRLQSPAH